MTRNMAFELAPHGIGVNCVIPGAISERPGVEEDRERWARYARNIPIGRVGRAEDIAAAVLFFCLPESEFTTGQSMLVDGGHHAYLPEGRGLARTCLCIWAMQGYVMLASERVASHYRLDSVVHQRPRHT